jgi:hypothetical protein
VFSELLICKNGVVHESIGREHLEEMCNKFNESKLQQKADTPFTKGALLEDVVWLWTGPSICMMLDGTYEAPEEVDEYTKKLINQFRQNRKANEHAPCIKSLQRNGSPSGKDQQRGRPVDVAYCILEHGNQEH